MIASLNQKLEKISHYINLKEESHKSKTAITYMLVAGIFFVCSGTFIKQVKGVQPMYIFCIRSIISCILNSSSIMLKGREAKVYIQDKEVFNLIVKRVSLGFIADYFYVAMFKYLTVGDCTSLVLTYPIISSLLAGIFLNEKITKYLIFSLILCLIGIVFVCKPPFILHFFFKEYEGVQSNDLTTGMLTGLGFSLFLSLSIISTRRLSGKTTIQVLLQYIYLQAIIISGIFIINDGDFINSYVTKHNILMLLGTGFCHYIAQVLYNKSLFLEKASIVVPFSYTQVIFSFLSDVLVFRNDINIYSLFGCLLIVSGSYITFQQH